MGRLPGAPRGTTIGCMCGSLVAVGGHSGVCGWHVFGLALLLRGWCVVLLLGAGGVHLHAQA
jgi:hypothetical protein